MDKHRADKLDQLFKENLQNHEISPEEDYWPYLEKSLDKLSFYRFGWKHINIYNTSALVLLIPALYFLFRTQEPTYVPASPQQHTTDTILDTIAPKEDQTTSTDNIQTISKKKTEPVVVKEAKKTTPDSDKPNQDSVPAVSREEVVPIVLPEPVKPAEEKPKVKTKKIIYVVQQDTIVEKDTVKVRRKRKN